MSTVGRFQYRFPQPEASRILELSHAYAEGTLEVRPRFVTLDVPTVVTPRSRGRLNAELGYREEKVMELRVEMYDADLRDLRPLGGGGFHLPQGLGDQRMPLVLQDIERIGGIFSGQRCAVVEARFGAQGEHAGHCDAQFTLLSKHTRRRKPITKIHLTSPYRHPRSSAFIRGSK